LTPRETGGVLTASDSNTDNKGHQHSVANINVLQETHRGTTWSYEYLREFSRKK
jgi:hypothetical protein